MQEIRLIDANALINELDKMICSALLTDTQIHYALVREIVAQQPTIEAEPVRHSEWLCVNKEESVWMCDNCGNEIEMKGTNPIKIGLDWCPYCGSRMDGGADNG